jgi:arylsulfatase A
MILTHSPYESTPDSAGYHSAKSGEPVKGQAAHRNFVAMVEYADKLIGRIVAKLGELGLRERTLILFLGDNGTGRGIMSQMGERSVAGGKGAPHDGGMHVPLIASGAGVRPGIVVHDLIDTTDFLPTICAAAGIGVPPDLPLDGRSFLPQLRGERGTPREWIYCWYAPDGGATADAEFARGRNLKLLRDGRLFDVRCGDRSPPAIEAGRLSDEQRTEVAQLQATLDRYREARPQRIAAIGGKGEKKPRPEFRNSP